MTIDVINPMLEDDDEVITDVRNPMLEDDEEHGDADPSTSPATIGLPLQSGGFKALRRPLTNRDESEPIPSPTMQRPVEADTRQRLSGAVSKPENIGKAGFDSLGRRIVKRAPRARATEKDALKLAFIAISGVTTDEAISLIQVADATGFQKAAGKLVAPSTVNRRMWQLSRLGFVHAWTVNGKTVWTITQDGIAAAQSYGFLLDDLAVAKDIANWTPQSVQHKLSISMAMAHFISPSGLLRESLGLNPVDIDSIIGESHILRAQSEIEQDVFTRRNAHEDITYGSERARILREAQARIAHGSLRWDSLMDAYPELWTIGAPAAGKGKALGKKNPDFVVSREEGRGKTSRSILVEVELSWKQRRDYEAILHTFQREVIDPVVFERVVYFTSLPGLEAKLREIDHDEQLGLFESRRLAVLPLTGRAGQRIRYKQKTIGQPKS